MPSPTDLARARNAIGGIESSNRYDITGPATKGNVPLGRYQVMASNLPDWSQAALGRQVSPQEYLSSPELQDAVFNHRFGGYMDRYGPEGAARAWFGGEGRVHGPGDARDSLGTSVRGYGQKFLAAYNGSMDAADAASGFDASSMSDDDIRRELGLDISGMSDDDLRKELGLAQTADSAASARGPAAPVGPEGIALQDVPAAAASNIGSDWEGIKQGVSSAIKDPLGTAVAAGRGLFDSATDPAKVGQRALMVTNPALYAILYGKRDYEAGKREVAEHPLQTAANVATFAAPGAGGVTRGALRAVTGAVGAADRVVAGTVGRLATGVSGPLQREALEAGIAGGRRAEQFRGQMRGTADPDDVVRLADEAEDVIHQRGLADRSAMLADGAGSQAAANTGSRLNGALQAARRENRDAAGIVQNAEIEGMLDDLARHIDDAFPGGNPRNAAVLSVEGMDALKRRLGDTLSDAGAFGGRGAAGRIGGPIYNEVRQAIVDAFPDYAPGMARAERNVSQLQQVRRQLGLGSRSRATTAGKLQRAARNDASSAYGANRQQLDILARERPELMSALAGQAMGSLTPRGLSGPLAGPMALAHVGMGNVPLAIAQYLASIPRLQGEVRYALGSTIRGARRAGLTQRNAGNLLDALRLAADEEQDQG